MLARLSLSDRTMLITGGSSGIGLATAKLFLAEGASVTICGRSRERLNVACEELNAGRRVKAVAGDVSKAGDAARMVSEHISAFGCLDYLFCNAGLHRAAPIEELDEPMWDEIVGVNLKGVYTVIKAAVPHMKSRGGAIVTTASEAGLVGQATVSAYCAAKAGVINLTRALALELIEYGIRVNCLCPGITGTPLCDAEIMKARDPNRVRQALAAWAPAQRCAAPLEQAQAVLFLMRDATFSVGTVLVTDGGYTAR
jgi:NAD(P)-dependent dehydrogenase (short-subunit alcohol dehydrogenase family)